jgi:protein-S-isoprenylcysteine O-methyltransferase Ste14
MIAFIPLWYMECRKEEKEMIKMHGQEYIDYRKKTGMFLPKIMKCF